MSFNFFKKVSSANDTSIRKEFSLAKLEEDGKIYILRFNKWLWNVAPYKNYYFQIGVATPLKTNRNGFPDTEENAQLFEVEDSLIKILDKIAIFAGSILGGGMKELVFYTSDPKKAELILKNFFKEIKHHHLQLIIQEDKTWEVYKTYCPIGLTHLVPKCHSGLSRS